MNRIVLDMGIGASDALGLYLAETRRFPILRASEEKRLARVVRKPSGSESSSSTARDRLVERNLRLVVSVARRYTHLGMELADLVQEGNLGLLRAVDRFDPGRGVRFSTYAVWWIRQAIIRALSSKSRPVRVPMHQAHLARKAIRQRDARTALGETLGVADIARELGASAPRLESALAALTPLESLDALVVEGGTPRWQLLADDRAISPWSCALRNETREKVNALIETLPQRERTILRLRFALGFARPHTLEEIGSKLHLTRERVRQIEREALSRLRRAANERGLRALLVH